MFLRTAVSWRSGVMRQSMPRPLVTGAAGFAGGHLLELLARDRVELVAWHRPGGRAAARRARRHDGRPVDLLDRTAVRAALARLAPVDGVSLRRRRPRRALVGAATESTLAVNVRGTHHLFEGLREARRRRPRPDPELGDGLRPVGRALREEHPLARPARTGSASSRRRLVGAENPGGPAGVHRARRSTTSVRGRIPSFVASGFARRIADIEAGRWPPEIAVGNLDARRDLTDVRDTVRAYRLILERGTAGRAVQRLHGPRGRRSAPCWTCCSHGRACRSQVTSIRRGTARTTCRWSSATRPDSARARLDAEHPPRTDAGRSAGVLARAARP